MRYSRLLKIFLFNMTISVMALIWVATASAGLVRLSDLIVPSIVQGNMKFDEFQFDGDASGVFVEGISLENAVGLRFSGALDIRGLPSALSITYRATVIDPTVFLNEAGSAISLTTTDAGFLRSRMTLFTDENRTASMGFMGIRIRGTSNGEADSSLSTPVGQVFVRTDFERTASFNGSFMVDNTFQSVPVSPVPLPASTILFASGLIGVVVVRRLVAPQSDGLFRQR
jgi:hypothetical protein